MDGCFIFTWLLVVTFFFYKGNNSLVHTPTPLVSKKEGRRGGGPLFWLTLWGGVKAKVTKQLAPAATDPCFRLFLVMLIYFDFGRGCELATEILRRGGAFRGGVAFSLDTPPQRYVP